MTDILARQRQLIGTTAEWAADDLVIGNGELAIERVSAAQIKIKVGDGVNKYSALPYVTSSPASAVAGGLAFKGSRDVTAAAPAGASAGDYYVASATGTPAGSWTGLVGHITKGDLVLFDGAAWHSLAQDVDLTKYLPIAGGTLTGPLLMRAQTGAGAAAPAMQEAVSKAYVDSLGEATGGTATTAGKFPKLDAHGLVPATMIPPSTPAAAPRAQRNVLINGDMRISQRHAALEVTPTAAVTYTVDRWHLDAAKPASFRFQQVTHPADVVFPKRLKVRVPVGTANAGDTFIRQVIESDRSAYMVGGKATFSGLIQVGANFAGQLTASIRFSTIEDEASTTIAAAGPTGGLTPVGHTIPALAAGVLTPFKVTGDVPANAKTIIVEIAWAAPAVGVGADCSFEMTGMQLESGIDATSFEHRPYTVEYPQCARYFYSTFMPDVAPAQGAGTDNAFCFSCLNPNTKTSVYIPFANQMRKKPTLTFYNPMHANAQAVNASRSLDCSGTAGFNSGVNGVSIVTVAPGGATAQGDGLLVHITADAEI